MKTTIGAILLAIAIPAAAPAQPPAPAADSCTPEHAAMGHCTPKGAGTPAPDAHAAHEKGDGEMPCHDAQGGCKMACCAKMRGGHGGKNGSADPHAGHDMSKHGGHQGHAQPQQ